MTLLTEEEAEHTVPRSKGGIVFKCYLQSLDVQSGWLLAGKGWALVTSMRLEKDGIFLNLRRVLSSDHQDQHRASAGECVGNISGASTSFLRTWAICSGTTLEAQNPAPQ